MLEKLSVTNEDQIKLIELHYENEINILQNNLQKANKINEEITK